MSVKSSRRVSARLFPRAASAHDRTDQRAGCYRSHPSNLGQALAGEGHDSIETTQIYLDAKLQIKQADLDKVAPLDATLQDASNPASACG
ncbi:hypothetical protein [Aromatoleum petrolei]|uniref:Tyrosine-type recombinase/integrase n=1 Tax=Aromatoleum petrolei TaxID=76116 RepID=A0ABX1MLH2_9RHOO|nr:hypothetical protein [Aromatoleum petrolei]NMF88593.1 hypothetical protein [Aromatoleum petrolei]